MVYEDACVQTQRCSAPTPQAEHILIIDDDSMQAEVLAHRFQKQKYRTSIAVTATQGLAVARAAHPELVVLDIRLPDSDGLHVCRELADNPATCDIPIIIVSGMEGPDIVRQARAAGCQYYVRKPYDPNALLILVQHAIADSQCW